MSLDLDAIKERADAATPGPWLAATDNNRKNGIGIVGELSKRGTGQAIAVFAAPDSKARNADARFTAAARDDIPVLVAEVERLRKVIEAFRQATSRIEALDAFGELDEEQVALTMSRLTEECDLLGGAL